MEDGGEVRGANECGGKDRCGWWGCGRLLEILVRVFGEDWRGKLFNGTMVCEFDIGEVRDLALLLGLGQVDSAAARFFNLLGQRSRRPRVAHRLVCGWRKLSRVSFRTSWAM